MPVAGYDSVSRMVEDVILEDARLTWFPASLEQLSLNSGLRHEAYELHIRGYGSNDYAAGLRDKLAS